MTAKRRAIVLARLDGLAERLAARQAARLAARERLAAAGRLTQTKGRGTGSFTRPFRAFTRASVGGRYA
jgi:hypothetical protein